MKIVTIVGARPQFIKAAAVSREIGKYSEIHEVIVHTGQHFDANMSEIFFTEMEIPKPDYSLEINSMGHGAMTGRMLEKIEAVLLKEQPDWVLVYGDTNSTLAGALAAKKLHIRMAHVEAGLRSFNMAMPEEINRILTDRISDLLCCPTDKAVFNLQREGFDNFPCHIIKTGDVMLDAVRFYASIAATRSNIIDRLNLQNISFALCTVHRAENTDDPRRLTSIVAALNEISCNMPVVMPLHPRTRKILADRDLSLQLGTIEPVGYLDMLELLRHCAIVLTDSGGLQKEACFFGKPCLTLRDETEWWELVDAGVNILVGADAEKIVKLWRMMTAPNALNLDFNIDFYGNQKAAEKIVQNLLQLTR